MTKNNMILERNDVNMSHLSSDSNANQSIPSVSMSPEPAPTSDPRRGTIVPDWIKQFATRFGAELLLVVICGFLAWTFTPLKELVSLPDKFEDFSNDVNTRLSVLEAQYGTYSTRIDSIDDKLFDLARQGQQVSYSPTDEMIYKIERTLTFRDSCSNDLSHLVDKVVYDDNGVGYDSADLAREKLLLSYQDADGQDVFFYGQLDASGVWDGHCIVNIYKNQELTLITDAEYNSGTLITYKQVFPSVTANSIQDDIWVVSDRISMDSFSSGETWHYLRDTMIRQTFETADATAGDIISVQNFMDIQALEIEGYYSGNISNGYFNDNTGKSYIVKFFSDGTVKILYFGNFVNGQMDDNTGNAWMIGKNDVFQETYAYYKGKFSNGSAIESGAHWKNSITQDFIDKIIDGKSFGCDLKWELDRI